MKFFFPRRNTPQWSGATSWGFTITPHWIWLFWTIYRPCPETFTSQNSTFTGDRHHGQVGFEPTIPASEQPQTDPALSGRCLCLDGGGGSEIEQTWTGLFHDLYHHTQHYCSIILSHTANCWGRYKWIRVVSRIPSKISHPLCCKLAQMVALSSPTFSAKLSVWLPSSCNSAPLIAKATTQKWPSVSPSDGTTYCAVIEWADQICWMNGGRGSQSKCLRHRLVLCQPCMLNSQTVGFSHSGVIENL